MKKKSLVISVIVALTAIISLVLCLIFVSPKHLQKIVEPDGIVRVEVVHRAKLNSDSTAMETRTTSLNDEQLVSFIEALKKESYYIRFSEVEADVSLLYVIEYENGSIISFDGHTIEKYNTNNTLVFSKKVNLKNSFFTK